MKSTTLFRYSALLLLQCLINSPLFAQITNKIVFNNTGSDQTFVVPSGVNQITVKAWGAGGAGGDYVFNDIGGGGGFVTGTISVTPGETLTIIVGSGGQPGAGDSAYGGGGGKECGVGGRGGGRSAVINSLGKELITAGAGGGGGGVAQADEVGGHGGGGLAGEPDNWVPYGGGGGTQFAPGDGGVSEANGNCPCGSNPGSGHIGGYAGCYDNGYNGSGGGGWFGGGSGTDLGDGAGGGGSSQIPPNGSTISATSDIPGNTSDIDYDGTAGHGGAVASAGNPGLVVLLYGGPPTISISDVTVYESDSVAALLVQLSQKLTVPIELTYATADSTAKGGKKTSKVPIDYISSNGKVTISAGQQTALIIIKIIKDNIIEDTEYFKVFIGQKKTTIKLATIIKGIGIVTILDGARPINGGIVQAKNSNSIKTAIIRLTATTQPNPTSNFFILITHSKSYEPININVRDAVGRLIETRKGVSANGTVRLGDNYHSGLYYAEVIQGRERVIIKLTKGVQ